MKPTLNLFGELDVWPFPKLTAPRKHVTRPNGYARRPGTGPAGQTCGTCAHCVRVQGGSRRYAKCLVIRHRWTHGPGTDILKKSPACALWQAEGTAAPGGNGTGQAHPL